MAIEEVKDKDGNVVGSIASYPDTVEDREELILREGAKAAEALKLPPGVRQRFGRRRGHRRVS